MSFTKFILSLFFVLIVSSSSQVFNPLHLALDISAEQIVDFDIEKENLTTWLKQDTKHLAFNCVTPVNIKSWALLSQPQSSKITHDLFKEKLKVFNLQHFTTGPPNSLS